MPAFSFATIPAADDELGVWQMLPPATDGAFPAGSIETHAGAAVQDASAWHISLPEDAKVAGEALVVAQARLRVSEAAMPYALQRLAAFRDAGGPSVAVPIAQAGPELDLANWVAASASGRPAPEAESGLAQVSAFFDRVRDALAGYAAIDTGIGSRRAALTLVSWTGDFRTVWASGLALDDAKRHTAAVALALRTRDAWLHLALTVLAGALQLAALFAANSALALPAAYRFVRQVIDQVQALHGLPALA